MERIIHGTRRYGILLRLFKLVAREWAQWTGEVSSQTKNKGINNSRMKITQWVGAKAQDGKMLWIMITKLSFIEFVLTDRRKISDKRKNWPVTNLPGCRFSFSPARNAIIKATEYVTFFLFLQFLADT